MDLRLFRRIKKLFQSMHDENYHNAQGDDGYDILRREKHFMGKLEKMLNPPQRFSKDVRKALAETMLPNSFLSQVKQDGEKLAERAISNKDMIDAIKKARKFMFVDDSPGLRGDSQLTVATCTYALSIRKKLK